MVERDQHLVEFWPNPNVGEYVIFAKTRITKGDTMPE
jgi:hypothetical protein